MSLIIALTSEELSECFSVRERVFVQEQSVPRELEMDELDAVAVHFLWQDDVTGKTQATARLLDKGQGTAKIGRVAVLAPFRGQGLGRKLMLGILAEAQHRGFSQAVLDAQTYAVPFYARLGFIAEGEEFLDAGIPHYHMQRDL